jgi:hypothetical protein
VLVFAAILALLAPSALADQVRALRLEELAIRLTHALAGA